MRRDAEAHADEDKRKRELADLKNEADQTIWQIEKALTENADKIPEGDKTPIQSAIERLKQAASGNDVNAIRQALSNLQSAAHAMSQHLNRGGEGGPGQGGPTPGARPGGDGRGGQGKEDVIDAEFEVKK